MKTTAQHIADGQLAQAKAARLQFRQPKQTKSWLLGLFLLAGLCLLCASQAAQAQAVRTSPTINYVERSLNKTVITSRSGSTTVQAPAGSGVRHVIVVTPPRTSSTRRIK